MKPSYVASSYAQSIIESDSEGDDQSSQTSSIFSGTSSFRAKRNFLDVERLIDKLEPLEETQSKIIDRIEDTIQEEKMQNQDESTSFLKKRPQIFNELKKHHKHQELIQKLSEHADEASASSSSQKMRLRSTSFTNEPIAQVQETGANECDDIDPMHHHFRISKSISLFGQKRKKERFHYDFRCDSPIMRPKKLDLTQNSENSSQKQRKKSTKKGNSHIGYLSGSQMAIISDQQSSNTFQKIKEQAEKQNNSKQIDDQKQEKEEEEDIDGQGSISQQSSQDTPAIEQEVIVEENQNQENGSGNELEDEKEIEEADKNNKQEY